MTQDFAKIRPEPLLERKPTASPPPWSFMLTGIIVGITIGVFACVLFYLSGNVPPLGSTAIASVQAEPAQPATEEPLAPDREGVKLDFYTALPDYEVEVDATPVALTPEQSGLSQPVSYLLQSGAFQQPDLAEQERQRQARLGLEVFVKAEQLMGRTLFLVQSGPYADSRSLDSAEQLLRRNNITWIRLSEQ